MRLLVVNCNTSQAVTAVITENARRAAAPTTEIIGIQPSWGPESAEGYFESFVSAAAVLDAIAVFPDPFDAVIMAGYGEHGREGVRQMIAQPVVDITEASAQLASLVSHRFGVVTTLQSTVAGIIDSLETASLMGRCAGVLATDIPVISISEDADDVVVELAKTAAILIGLGADSIVLGCAAFAGLDAQLEAVLGLPVFDSVTSAVVLAEGLVRLGKSTSKVGPYSAPSSTKQWQGWPISPRKLGPAASDYADRVAL
jgi:allantoin racemase